MASFRRLAGCVTCTFIVFGIATSVAEGGLVRALLARIAERRQAAAPFPSVSPSVPRVTPGSGFGGTGTVVRGSELPQRYADVAPSVPTGVGGIRTIPGSPAMGSGVRGNFGTAVPQATVPSGSQSGWLRREAERIKEEARRRREETELAMERFRRDAERFEERIRKEQRALEAQSQRQREELERWQERTRRLLNEPQRSGLSSQSFPGRPLPEPFAPALPQAQRFTTPSIAPSTPIPRIHSPASPSISIPTIQSPPMTPSFSRPSFGSPSISSPRITTPSLGTGSF